MSETPAHNFEEVLAAVRECATAMIALTRIRTLYSDAENAYTPCLNSALSHILHLLANLAQDGVSLQDHPDEPWFDFGLEPLTAEDAEAHLPDFLKMLQTVVGELSGPYPLCCIEVRATTFALLLEPSS